MARYMTVHRECGTYITASWWRCPDCGKIWCPRCRELFWPEPGTSRQQKQAKAGSGR